MFSPNGRQPTLAVVIGRFRGSRPATRNLHLLHLACSATESVSPQTDVLLLIYLSEEESFHHFEERKQTILSWLNIPTAHIFPVADRGSDHEWSAQIDAHIECLRGIRPAVIFAHTGSLRLPRTYIGKHALHHVDQPVSLAREDI